MIIPIIGRSAIEFWLGPGAAISTDYSFNNRKSLSKFPEKFDFLVTSNDCRKIADSLALSFPVETFSYNHNNHQIEKASHVFTRYKPFLEKSFVRFKLNNDDIFVASPEFCFLQAAKSMDLQHLVHLGMQLCSSYFLQSDIKVGTNNRAWSGSAQKNRIPITTVKQIKNYLSKASGEYGIKLARRAVKYIVDGANSPMEASLATMMSLPFKYGGYGMPRFTMNEPLALTPDAMEYYHYDSIRGDFYWEENKTVGEYNSNAFHMSAEQQTKDSIRTNTLQRSGYHVVPITYGNLRHFSDVERTMKMLMETLERPELKLCLEDNKNIRQMLCQEFLGSDQDYYERFHK